MSEDLAARHCVPCEGGVPHLTLDEAQQLLTRIPGWRIVAEGLRIRKEWTVRNFLAGIDFFRRVADLAEEQGHHPDLHLESYRHVTVEIWTHAIGGLSENDFILAARIDRLPIKLKAPDSAAADGA